MVKITATFCIPSVTADISMSQYAGLPEAYPWPIYKPWFDHRITSNATGTGTLAALAFGTAAFR